MKRETMTFTHKTLFAAILSGAILTACSTDDDSISPEFGTMTDSRDNQTYKIVPLETPRGWPKTSTIKPTTAGVTTITPTTAKYTAASTPGILLKTTSALLAGTFLQMLNGTTFLTW